MEIREAVEEELDRLVEIWLKGSIQAHAFIEPTFWEENVATMRGLYLPLSENFVAIDEEKIKGFVSLMGEELAALFVDPEAQRKGVGKNLLAFAKDQRDVLFLNVYLKNKGAVAFYQKQAFEMIETQIDEPTGETEYRMQWRK